VIRRGPSDPYEVFRRCGGRSIASPGELHILEVELAIGAAEIETTEIFLELNIERTEPVGDVSAARAHRAANVIPFVVVCPIVLAIVLALGFVIEPLRRYRARMTEAQLAR
jgi:hypothetical protein